MRWLRVMMPFVLTGALAAGLGPRLAVSVAEAQEPGAVSPTADSTSGALQAAIDTLYRRFDIENPDSMFRAISDIRIHQGIARFEDGRWVFPARFGAGPVPASECRAAALTHTIRVSAGLNQMNREGDFAVNMKCPQHRVRVEVLWAERITVTEYLRQTGEVIYEKNER